MGQLDAKDNLALSSTTDSIQPALLTAAINSVLVDDINILEQPKTLYPTK